MEIIPSRPPNFHDILPVFPMASRMGVIFAYAPNIYAPGGRVPPEIIAHERVHIQRQEHIGVELWWARYLVDTDFRYKEELLAHRAEYHYLIGETASRQVRRVALKQVARKLAAPLYGKLVTTAQAMGDILS